MGPRTGETPRIIIDPDANEDIARRIRFFDKLAHEKPVELQHALFVLGEAATDQTIDRSEISTRKTSLKRSPREVLLELFSQRYDDSFNYDEGTLSALQNDVAFKALSLEREKADARRKTMSPKDVNQIVNGDYKAGQTRDALRRYRIAYFLRRMINRVPNESSEGELRSVS